MIRRVLMLNSMLVFLTVSASAQNPTIVVENGRVIVGDGTVLERGSVVVAGEQIVSITDEEVEAPDARRIDASGRTVLPGLIDAHVHLIVPPGQPDSASWARFLDDGIPGVLQEFLDHGVTTVRSTGDIWPEVGDLRDRVAAGELPGPRIVAAGPAFMAEGGHPILKHIEGCRFCRSHVREVTDPEQAREIVRMLAGEGVDFVKIVAGSPILEVQLDDAVVEAIVDEAHREGLRALGHVAEDERMEAFAEAGMDGFAHLPLEDVSGHRPPQLARVLTRYQTPVTTTTVAPFLFDPALPIGPVVEGEAPLPEDINARLEHAAILADAGVPIVVGSDWSGFAVEYNDHPSAEGGAVTITEMQMLHWGGMSRHAIIQAATSNAARALEMSDRIGTLEPGKLADLIVVDGNPLEDLSALRNVEIVVKEGEVVASRSKLEATGASSVKRQEWSRAQRQVWEREVTYWEAVAAADVERFMSLWDERFVGWPAGEEAPVRRADLPEEVETWFSEVRSSDFDHELTPMAVTIYDEVAVTFYRVRNVYGDPAREGHEDVGRLTHVWRKRDGEWMIIGGMSAPADTGEANR